MSDLYINVQTLIIQVIDFLHSVTYIEIELFGPIIDELSHLSPAVPYILFYLHNKYWFVLAIR